MKAVEQGNSKNSKNSANGYICDTCIGVELKSTLYSQCRIYPYTFTSFV